MIEQVYPNARCTTARAPGASALDMASVVWWMDELFDRLMYPWYDNILVSNLVLQLIFLCSNNFVNTSKAITQGIITWPTRFRETGGKPRFLGEGWGQSFSKGASRWLQRALTSSHQTTQTNKNALFTARWAPLLARLWSRNRQL